MTVGVLQETKIASTLTDARKVRPTHAHTCIVPAHPYTHVRPISPAHTPRLRLFARSGHFFQIFIFHFYSFQWRFLYLQATKRAKLNDLFAAAKDIIASWKGLYSAPNTARPTRVRAAALDDHPAPTKRRHVQEGGSATSEAALTNVISRSPSVRCPAALALLLRAVSNNPSCRVYSLFQSTTHPVTPCCKRAQRIAQFAPGCFPLQRCSLLPRLNSQHFLGTDDGRALTAPSARIVTGRLPPLVA
jgi:hypothetical protein